MRDRKVKFPKPDDYDVPAGELIDGTPRCAAWSRNSGSGCRKPAGWGTEHIGLGRCAFHGGKTPYLHGGYSQVVKGGLAKKLAEHEGNANPLDVTGELAVVRTLLDRWITNNAGILMTMRVEKDATGKVLEDPIEILSIAVKLTDQVSKQVARIERIRAVNALSLPELKILVRKLAAVVERVVQEPDRLEQIATEWQALLTEVQSTTVGEHARAAFAVGEETE